MSAARTSPTPDDQLRTRLTQLLDVDTNVSAEEKTQLISNLCFIVNANKRTVFDPQTVHLVLGEEGGWYTMYFIDVKHRIRSRGVPAREKALDELRIAVEERIAAICKVMWSDGSLYRSVAF